MLSIFSPHFFNWTAQLQDTGHEVYWMDISDSNTYVGKIDFTEQILGWRYKIDYPGRYFLKRKAPGLTRVINCFNERNFQKQLKKQIEQIEPDLIHSFVMYLGCVPALPVMQKYPHLPWAYSAWGSDLYYYQNKAEYLEGIKETLPLIDYMFSDCQRDFRIAKKYGFKGEFLGVFPGGGGFDFISLEPLIEKEERRNIILIKGYQGLHGKCISVLEAILKLDKKLDQYRIVIFGATPEVLEFVKSSPLKEYHNLEVYGKLCYSEIMRLMGKSLIYIGNSSSDGIPNTLLEAIVMEVFPIQSNPGGATGELIEDENGFLIKDPKNSDEIAALLLKAVSDPLLRREAVTYNTKNIKPKLERRLIEQQVIKKYQIIEENLKQ